MELRQLRYFVAVAEELHFGRAAARVHIAQPPLSQQIKGLEEEIGTRLLERTRRRVELTPAGRAFLTEARAILARAGAAAEEARRAGRGEAGKLTAGFMGPAMDAFLAEAVGLFRAVRPGVGLVLREMGTPAQLEALEAGDLDVGFVRHTGQIPPGLSQAVVHRESYILALPGGHPLARLSEVPAARLDGLPFIGYPRESGPALHAAMLAGFARAGAAPRIVQEVASKRSTVALVAAGMGLALVPASTAVWRRPGVVFRPVIGHFPPVEMAAAWRGARLTPAASALVNMACEASSLSQVHNQS